MTEQAGDSAPGNRTAASKKRGPSSAVRYLGPAVLYVAGVFVMGSIELDLPPVAVSDKTAHLVVFGLMVLPLLRATEFFVPERSFERRLVQAAMCSSAVGALLEIWQAELPYRSAELMDWVADTVGAVIVAVAVLLLRTSIRRSRLPRARP